MKEIILILTSTIFSVNCIAQNWQWAYTAGGAGEDNGRAIAVDAFGNSYVTGSFYDTAAFGSNSLISIGGPDIFVAKYDINGNCLWAKRGGGISLFDPWGDSGMGITIDESGDCYITGNFIDSASFGPFTLTGVGSYVFVVKYDTSGNVVWARQSINGGGVGQAITSDNSGNIYITGTLGGGQPTFGTFILNQYSGFIVKYDTNGNVIWATDILGGIVHPRGIDVNSSGYLFVTGEMWGSDSINNQYYQLIGGIDLFITKFGIDGSFKWFSHAGYSVNVNYAYGTEVSSDGYGNAYVTGYFMGNLMMGSTLLNGNLGYEAFVAKYDSSGNILWAKQSITQISYADNFGGSITTDLYGNSYVLGKMNDSILFDNDFIPGGNSPMVFVIKFDSNGNSLGMNTSSGLANPNGAGIGIDNAGSIYITGWYKGIPLMFGSINASLAFSGSGEMYIAKLSSINSIDENIINDGTISLSPNPATKEITIQSSKLKVESVEVFDVMGQRCLTPTLSKGEGVRVDVSSLASGIYFVKLRGEKEERVAKFVKQ